MSKKFRISDTFVDIKNEMADFLYDYAHFECYSDGVFTYELSEGSYKGSYTFEFNFICDDVLEKEMTVNDILNLRRVRYFKHSIIRKDDTIVDSWTFGDDNFANLN